MCFVCISSAIPCLKKGRTSRHWHRRRTFFCGGAGRAGALRPLRWRQSALLRLSLSWCVINDGLVSVTPPSFLSRSVPTAPRTLQRARRRSAREEHGFLRPATLRRRLVEVRCRRLPSIYSTCVPFCKSHPSVDPSPAATSDCGWLIQSILIPSALAARSG